jgi:sortase A
MRKFLKKNLVTFLLLILLVAGLGLLAYPSVADWWNTLHGSRAIVSYDQNVANMEQEKIDAMFEAAESYNEALQNNPGRFLPSDEEHETYESLLSVEGTSLIGYLYIPSIRLNLPIYHGTDESQLQTGIGHLEGSSLPVGGKGTHAVLSGHRGLPSARLLTDLDQMCIGDTFEITVLNQTLTYEVDQIRIVLPDELDSLAIDPEQDYVTLVTCTPYGINTHRLLVRGHRTSGFSDASVVNEASVYDNYVIAPFLAIPLLFVLIFGICANTRKKKAE